jgi:SSS family solute:Na+ symporter
VFILIVVALSYLIGLKLQGTRGVFKLGVWCFSGFASLFPVLFAAIYWRRATKAGAYASILAAAGTWFWLFRDSGYGASGEHGRWGLTPVTLIFAASTIALILVSLVTRPPSPSTVEKFFGAPKYAH